MRQRLASRIVWLSVVILAAVGLVIVALNARRTKSRRPVSAEVEALSKMGVRVSLCDDGQICEAINVGASALPYLQNATELKLLRLGRGCPGDSLRYVRDLRNIQFADFSYANVADRHLEYITGWRRLSTLYLSGAAITDDGMRRLLPQPEFYELYLINTSVTDAGLEVIARIDSLMRLGLEGAPIAGPGLRHLAKLKDLIDLNLANTGVTDDSLADISGCVRLTRLSLRGTQIRGPGLASLTRLLELESLDLRETPASRRYAVPLIKAIPRLWIFWNDWTDQPKQGTP